MLTHDLMTGLNKNGNWNALKSETIFFHQVKGKYCAFLGLIVLNIYKVAIGRVNEFE